ncbi:stromal cell-derived factor 2-like protein 1 [Oscarella lobularis]|uniref:stromal cell-derived factor 2-like protein 1 n=1 Tax=Oscarella lobularis TaxID=121494 RepID=UPI00331343BC
MSPGSVLVVFLASFVASTTSAGFQYVTCGSVLKLLHIQTNSRLHSHEVRYGSGSGQQSVTGVSQSDDANSYWVVKGTEDKPCRRGNPIKCGATIRLNHLSTRLNLHSHLFQSPLSNHQEVSAFGENGVGDTGDYWTLECDDEYWERDEAIIMKHKDTGMFLSATGHTYGRPIHGQREIVAVSDSGYASQWKAMEGVYVKPSEEK